MGAGASSDKSASAGVRPPGADPPGACPPGGYSLGSYPSDLERDVPLRDGGSIHVRPIRPDDAPRLQASFARLSRDTIFMRFFSPLPTLSNERAAYFTNVDYDRRLAIVAVERAEPDAAGPDVQEQIVGVVRYDRSAHPDDGLAEFALVVEDRYQHHGIGIALFWALVEAARARGVRVLAADVLAENRRMLRLLRESGLPLQSRRAGSAIRLELSLDGPADAQA